MGSPDWHAIKHVTKIKEWKKPSTVVCVRAEQETLETGKMGKILWQGYNGPRNIHTRKLRFTCDGKVYLVPQLFIEDLLDLHVDERAEAAIDGKNIVFAISGADGEKYYIAYFQFQNGKFMQRLLNTNELYIITLKTNVP